MISEQDDRIAELTRQLTRARLQLSGQHREEDVVVEVAGQQADGAEAAGG